MWLYLDTSALLRAVVERDRPLGDSIAAAGRLLTCRLAHLEAARALRRLQRERPRAKASLRLAERQIAIVLGACLTAELNAGLMAGAEREFPVEPVRSLDAIHLAAALWWRDALAARAGEALVIASTDQRLRANAAALGFPLLPR